MGGTEDFGNFVNAVIDAKAFAKITSFIDDAKKDSAISIFAGGGSDDTKGYFVEPTILLTTDPKSRTMVEEIFGPVLTIYIYMKIQIGRIL